MPDELTQAFRELSREVHAILDHLLREQRRIAKRLHALDAETPSP